MAESVHKNSLDEDNRHFVPDEVFETVEDAKEALKAFLPVIMAKVGIDKVYGICVSENVASKKVMEKCGFQKEFEGMGLYQGVDRQIAKYVYPLGS